MELEEAKKTFNAYINAIDTFGTIDPRCCNNLYEPAKTILQELDRLQKENEILSKTNADLSFLVYELQQKIDDSTSKDKIREYYKKEYHKVVAQINVLENLLKEE